MDELLFVGIRDPVELRRDLLESSKSIIDSLKRYESYTSVKEEKLGYILQLKRVFDELIVLNKKLRSKLPKMPVKPAPVLLSRELEEVKRLPRKEHKSKIDVLEEELSKVESRLAGLE